MKTVAVDAMGGDHAPAAIVEGAVAAAREFRIPIVLVGRRDRVAAELEKHDAAGLPIELRHAADVVGMDDGPLDAIRRKKDNSIRVGLEMVRAGESGAFVSAGNSGAAMAAAVMICRPLPGVERPAIALELPSTRGPVTLLDAGANVEVSPRNLVEFAVMGHVLARHKRGLEAPRIGLLSNGEERKKGTDLTRAADAALRQTHLNYVGYVEGRDLNLGNCDVAVTDGFTGNVVLKTLEGFGKFMETLLRDLFTANWRTKLGYLLLKKELGNVRRTLDYDAVGGAPLLGINGSVIIAHGSSSARAIKFAIRVAANASTRGLDHQIQEALAELPDDLEMGAPAKRRSKIWNQLRSRFRRDGKEGRESANGDGPPDEVDETPEVVVEVEPPTKPPPGGDPS